MSPESRKAEHSRHRLCPWWLGYGLLNPLRRLLEDPATLLGPLVHEDMVVLEPGCGMGYFTLELARRVGPRGRVIAVDLQERMLSNLMRRARRKDLHGRIEPRLARAASLGVDDLAGTVDLAVAIHVVHELPDQGAFFCDLRRALRPDGLVLLVEPRGHVSEEELAAELEQAAAAGLVPRVPANLHLPKRAALLAAG